jgi:hypothetical protein
MKVIIVSKPTDSKQGPFEPVFRNSWLEAEDGLPDKDPEFPEAI